MQEGVFFPEFWNQNEVVEWKKHFLSPKTNELPEIRVNEDGNFWFEIDFLRKIYLDSPATFFQLRRLFQLFGLVVHVNRGQEIFESLDLHEGLTIVVDKRQETIKNFKIAMYRQPLLNSLELFKNVDTYSQLYGLILNRLNLINPLIDVDKVVDFFKSQNVPLSVTPVSTNNPTPEIMEHSRVKIVDVFDEIHEKVIINAFHLASIYYVDQITPESLEKVTHGPKIGIKKRQTITERLTSPIPIIVEKKDKQPEPDLNLVLPLVGLSLDIKNYLYKRTPNGILGLRKCHQSIKRLFKTQPAYHRSERTKANRLLKSYDDIINSEFASHTFSPNVFNALKNIDPKINQFDINNETLNLGWQMFFKINPDSVMDNLNQFYSALDDRKKAIFDSRILTIEKKTTLDQLGSQFCQTRERIRQIEVKLKTDFISWWNENLLTQKLLIETDAEVIFLDKVLGSKWAVVVNSLIISQNTELQKYWFTKDSYLESLAQRIKPELGDKLVINRDQLLDILSKFGIANDSQQLKSLLPLLNFQESKNPDTLISTKRRIERIEMIQLYCAEHQTDVVDVDEQHLSMLNEWVNDKFDRILFKSTAAANSFASSCDDIISIGKGKYRLFRAENYDRSVFDKAKQALDEHFVLGYPFVRDFWPMSIVQNLLPVDMTNDEFYQVFQRFYAQDYNYSHGRNNDIFRKDFKPISVTKQAELFLRGSNYTAPLSKFIQNFGWTDYTVAQLPGKNSHFVYENGNLSWLDFDGAKALIGADLKNFINAQMVTKKILPIQTVYNYFNQLFFGPLSQEISQIRIGSIETLIAFIRVLDLNVDIVKTFFLVSIDLNMKNATIEELWKLYLEQMITGEVSLNQIKQIFLDAGYSENTWVQRYTSLINNVGLAKISSDMYLPEKKIIHSSENDKKIKGILDDYLFDAEYISLKKFTTKDWSKFPEIQWPWRQELLANYARQLGYKSFCWPSNYFKLSFYVILPSNSQYNSLQDLMASLIYKWMKQNNNEFWLYDQAAKEQLVPLRNDEQRKVFPVIFKKEVGLRTNDIGNIEVIS